MRHPNRWFCCALLATLALPTQAQVVISQVYGAGGNVGAVLNRDYVELFNAGSTAVSLSGWSVQYASAAGSTWQATQLGSASLQPGQYLLVGMSSGANGSPLPTVDISGTTAMAAGAGKVALVGATGALSGTCPSGPTVLDMVGFGSGVSCFEGTGSTPAPSTTRSVFRGDAGCTDNNDNASDFSAAAPAPRNSASAFNVCGGSGTPNLSIQDVSLAEGDSGTLNAVFTVSLSAPAGAGGVQFDIATADGSATLADNDYQAFSATAQVIPAGATSASFSVAIQGDTQVEPDETFLVNVSNVTGANVVNAQATGTVINDDFTLISIHDIQGSGRRSPMTVGSTVATEGIVTARVSNGFFLQAATGEEDLDLSTSEGIFVFLGAAPPASAAVGNRVRVVATLDEFGATGLPLTELKNATIIALSSGNPLPAPIELTAADTNPAGSLDQLERYEGMRVSVSTLKVIAPVGGNISEANATSTSDGIFYGVLPGVPRPFREPGIDALSDIVPPPGVSPPVFDTNPERIRVRSTGQTGAPRLSVDVGDTINNLVGVLDYGFGAYTLTPDPDGNASVTPGSIASPVSIRAKDEITIGGFNLLRFFDTVNDPSVSDPVLTATAFNNRLMKTSNAICAYTRNPDILGVVEVENINALGALADAINTQAGNTLFPGSCSENPNYAAYLMEGNDVGGIDIGFLIKTAEVAPGTPRVEVLDIAQIGKDTLFANPDGSSALLNDRPSLVLRARIHQDNGASYDVTVIANHLRSLSGVDDTAAGSNGWATDGERIRAKRAAQAKFLADYIQDRQSADPSEKIVLLGDFNAFEFNDGFADSMGIITGHAAPATEVINYVASPITTPLTNMADLSPASERYSFSFDGNAQSLDHMVVNQALLDGTAAVRAEHARLNSDFGVDNFGDYSVPVRVSDHDPVVLFLGESTFDTVDLGTTVTPASASVLVGQNAQFTVNVSNTGIDDAHGAKLDLSIAVLPQTVGVVPAAGWTCGAPVLDGASSTLVHCHSDVFASGGTGEFLVTIATSAAQYGKVLSLGAAIDCQATDPVPANDNASASILVTAETDLRVRVRAPDAVNTRGKAGKFRIKLANIGEFPASEARLVFSVNAPASEVLAIDSGSFNCVMASDTPTLSTWSCRTDASYAAGRKDKIRVHVQAASAKKRDLFTLDANFTSATPDSRPGNNHDAASARIVKGN